MRFLTIILLLALTDVSFGQATWNGRSYNSPVCNKPNCQMCNAIRAQLSTPRYTAPTPTYTPTQLPVTQATARASTPSQNYTMQAVTKQVKRCNGKQCWYETVTEYVRVPTYTPPAPAYVPTPTYTPSPPPAQMPSFQKLAPPLDKVDKLVPTPEDATDIALQLLALTSEDVLFEPGCGDGRILAKSTCLSMGIELNPQTASVARGNAPNAIILTGDAATYDYSGATVVYMYLYPDLMNKIVPLLKPGTRVVSYCHSVPGIEWQQHTVNNHVFYTGTKP